MTTTLTAVHNKAALALATAFLLGIVLWPLWNG